jgi:hypothetical protein
LLGKELHSCGSHPGFAVSNQEKKETYMSKNLTRKGLALGAIVALGSSLFAGAPAFAGVLKSAEITLAPAAGTSYNTLAQSTFALTTLLDPTLDGASSQKTLSELSYLVLNSGAKAVTVAFDGAFTTDAATEVKVASADAAGDIGAYTGTITNGVASSKKAIVVTGRGNNTADASDVNNGKNTFTIGTTATDADVTVTVQAWLDDNNDGLIGAQEWTSEVRTVKFIQPANVTATTTVTSATLGTASIKGSVVVGNDINNENLPAGAVQIQFKNNGDIVPVKTGATSTEDSTDVAWDATSAALINANYTVGSVDVADAKYNDAITRVSGTAVLKPGTVIAQAYYKTSASTVVALGAASNAKSSTAGADVSVDGTDVLKVTGSANATAGADAQIRTGYQGDITFTSYVLSADSADTSTTAGKVSIVKVAGNKVKVTLTKSTDAFDAASTFTAGGVTLTATSGPVSFTALSDADGKISFTGKGTGVKGDSVVVSIAALGIAGYKTADTNTITWKDAVATSLVATDTVGASAELKTTLGGTYNVNLSLVDQFGQLFTSVRRVKIDNNGGSAIFAHYPEFVGGKVSQAIVDNSTAAGVVTVRATLQKKNASTGAWEADTAIGATNVLVVNVNAKVAASATGTASSTVAVATTQKTLVKADLRLDSNTQTATTIGYGSAATQTISGVVSDSTGAGVAGATVTVTGAGLGFVVNGNVYSVGSATIAATSTGSYSVDVYSTTAGKVSVVVASGAATKSVAIEFSGITTLDTKGTITLDVASLSQVGRAVTVTATVKDSYGNVVNTGADAIAVSVTGVGSLSVAKVETDADGKATFQFVAGANDFGDAVITAKYTNADDTVVSASKTVTVGITDAQIDVVGKRVTAVASFSKGKTVAFYVNGEKKWSKLSASDADVVLNYNLKKGRNTVTVKISGGFVTTDIIVVK